MEDVGGGCRRALDMVGGLLDLEAALEDVRKSRKDRHLEFAVLSAEFFFCTTPSCPGRGTSTGRPPSANQGEAVHSPHHRHHRLSSLTSQSHSHNTLRLLASLRRTFLRSGYRSGHYRNFCYLHFLTTSKVSWLFLVSSLTHSIQLAFHNQGSSKK